ncbi:hypothetical protein ACQB6R_03865 [Propionibacteriaceae bacterium G1746]|uniref:hypothetical protein n=1 Tax=Aestuariimicrobium sp. G57 TaxID=3418485 RepID=UPI003C2A81EB
MTTPANTKALQTGSGIAWDDWATWLDAQQAHTLDHAGIARLALGRIIKQGSSSSPEWWAQGVAVAYEQHIGRRLPGQRCEGDFSVTVSKTLPGDMDDVLARWSAHLDGAGELNGEPIVDGPRTSSTEKWRYWRVTMADGATVSVNITNKPGGQKSALAVNHDKLPTADGLEQWRTFWRGMLAEVAAAG